MELAARGTGAKGMITQKAVPFDPAALAAAMQGGGAAPAAGAGTPARGVPSPHPGMPPTAPAATPAPKKK